MAIDPKLFRIPADTPEIRSILLAQEELIHSLATLERDCKRRGATAADLSPAFVACAEVIDSVVPDGNGKLMALISLHTAFGMMTTTYGRSNPSTRQAAVDAMYTEINKAIWLAITSVGR